VGRGYWFYVSGLVPPAKDPRQVDEKLVGLYQVEVSKATRARRKQAGMASVQYLRFRRFFVLIATKGRHRFFEDHGSNVKDVRRTPIRFGGYAVGLREGRAHVRIADTEFTRLKAYFADLAARRSAEEIAHQFAALPFEPYAPVRRQLLTLLRLVNRGRTLAGLSLVSASCLRLKRKLYRPFEPLADGDDLLRLGNE
jgi:hypothetical protein